MGLIEKSGSSENGARCVSIWAGRPIIAVPLFPPSVLPTVLTVHNSNDNHLDLQNNSLKNLDDSDDKNCDHDADDGGANPGLNSPSHPYLVTEGKNYSGWPGENIRWTWS